MLTGEAVRLSCAKTLTSLMLSEVINIEEFRKFHDYDVYEDGRVFSHKSNRFL